MRVLDRLLRSLELLGAVILTFMMAGLFVGGVRKIGSGVVLLAVMDRNAEGIGALLRGIEYLFLAPVALLAYVSMVLFIRGFFRVTISPENGVGMVGTSLSNPYSSVVHSVKKSIAILIIAILLTDMVDKALANSTSNWLGLATEVLGVLLTGGYFVLLTRVDH